MTYMAITPITTTITVLTCAEDFDELDELEDWLARRGWGGGIGGVHRREPHGGGINRGGRFIQFHVAIGGVQGVRVVAPSR